MAKESENKNKTKKIVFLSKEIALTKKRKKNRKNKVKKLSKMFCNDGKKEKLLEEEKREEKIRKKIDKNKKV